MLDILLSLPIASYFLAPTVTSWSTSLNLLFFYMTWTTLVLSHSPLKIELVGGLAARLALSFLPSLLFVGFDTLIPSLSETIKYEGASALPPRNLRALGKQTGLAIFNILLLGAVQAGISLGSIYTTGEPLFQTSTTLPLPWAIVKHLLLLYNAREVLTYYIHRNILHRGGWIARLHSTYAHQDPAPPYSLMLYTDHPLPLLLHRLVPGYLPALLIRPHLLTYFFFTLLTTLEETVAMSGYSIVPGIMLGGVTRRTAHHYSSGGQGNYGAWGLLDWIHGTSVGKNLVSDARDEAEKHRVKQRGQKTIGDGTDAISTGIESLRNGKGKGGRKKGRKADA